MNGGLVISKRMKSSEECLLAVVYCLGNGVEVVVSVLELSVGGTPLAEGVL